MTTEHRKETLKAYRDTHKDELKAYRLAHLEEYKKYQRRYHRCYRETNPENLRATQAKYRTSVKAKLAADQKELIELRAAAEVREGKQ